MEAKEKEITDRRLVKLKVDGITIPFPEDIEQGWMKDFVYFPDLTMDCLCQEKYFRKRVKGGCKSSTCQSCKKC